MNRTIGVRDGPRPSNTPVSRTAKELPAGIVSEGTATVALGAVTIAVGTVEPGVKPGILLVVATGAVVVVSIGAASGSATVDAVVFGAVGEILFPVAQGMTGIGGWVQPRMFVVALVVALINLFLAPVVMPLIRWTLKQSMIG